jgi:uncharacterized membrane protein YccC
MLQVILLVVGVVILVKGEIPASANRVVKRGAATFVGLGLILAAGAPLIIPTEPNGYGVYAMVGIAAIATVLGLGMSKKIEAEDTTEESGIGAVKPRGRWD